MKKIPTIFFYITQQDGVGYYRMIKPAKMLEKLGLAKIIVNPFSPYGNKKETWLDLHPDEKGVPKCAYKLTKALGNIGVKPKADAIIMQRYDTVSILALGMALKMYGIPILQETDDYVWDVPGSNPGSLSYNEKKLEQQNTPEDPNTVARMTQGLFDGYIVSTPFLKNYYSTFAPTYECPNSIDFSKRNMAKRKGHKGIRIMFSASAGHLDSLKLIERAMDIILKKYPDVTFYQNRFLPSIGKGRPYNRRVKLIDWIKPEKYPHLINSLEPDICLAPLRDRLFNRAKSNLRLLEYWTSGKNAVIASPVGHYKDTATEGENILFARGTDEWVEKIELLIKDEKLRKKLGVNGYNLVKKDFNLETNARKWADAIKESIKNYDPDREPPKQFLPPELR